MQEPPPTPPSPQLPPQPGIMPGAMLSPDGRWRWDGTQWVPSAMPYGGLRPFAVFKSAAQLANFVVMALAVAAVCQGIGIIADLGRIDITNRLINGTGATVDEANSSDNLVALSGYLEIAAVVLGAVAFLMWLHRVVANNHALGLRRLEFTPGWAVGWWFIPFVNLVRPYQIVAETWHATDPEPSGGPMSAAKGDAPPLVLVWWLAYIAAGIVGAVAGGMSGSGATVQSLHDGTVVALFDHLLEIAAAGLGVLVVLRITWRQTALQAAVQRQAQPQPTAV